MTDTNLHQNDLLEFCIELPILLRSHIPVRKALEQLAHGTDSPNCRSLCLHLVSQMSAGYTLADAMRPYEYHLPPSFIPSLEAGENRARVEEVLELQAQRLKDGINNKAPQVQSTDADDFLEHLNQIIAQSVSIDDKRLIARLHSEKLISLDLYDSNECDPARYLSRISINSEIKNLVENFSAKLPKGKILFTAMDCKIYSLKLEYSSTLEIYKDLAANESHCKPLEISLDLETTSQKSGLHIALCSNQTEIEYLVNNSTLSKKYMLNSELIDDSYFSSFLHPSIWLIDDFLSRNYQIQMLLNTGQSVYLLLDKNNCFSNLKHISEQSFSAHHCFTYIRTLQLWEFIPILCLECRQSLILSTDDRKRWGLAAKTKTYRSKGCKNCDFTGVETWKHFFGLLQMNNDFIFEIIQDTSPDKYLLTLQENLNKTKTQAIRKGLIDPRWMSTKQRG